MKSGRRVEKNWAAELEGTWRLVGNWGAVQDGNQAVGYKMKPHMGGSGASGKLGSSAEGKRAAALEGIWVLRPQGDHMGIRAVGK